MRLVKDKKERLQKYFAGEPDIIAVYLFGSYGTERESPLSDIDFAVLFTEEVKVDLMREMGIMAQISAILKIEEVDLVNLNQAPVLLQHEAIKGELIFERDENQVADFEQRVLTFSYDERIRAREFYKTYRQALKEEYSDGRQN
jgi:predicted nucleotidyltransferase